MLSRAEGVHRRSGAGDVLLGKSADAVGHQDRVVVCRLEKSGQSAKPTFVRAHQKLTAMRAVTLLISLMPLALVLVIPHRVLREAAQDELLVARRLLLDPRLHVRAHLVLNLGRAVDKVRVVKGLQDCSGEASWSQQTLPLK